MTEEEILSYNSKRIEQLFDLYPIEDLNPVNVSSAMKDGLARLYADKELRNYLENAVKIAIKNLAISNTPVKIAYYQSRIDVLQQLLAKGQQCFTTTEVLRKGKPNATH